MARKDCPTPSDCVAGSRGRCKRCHSVSCAVQAMEMMRRWKDPSFRQAVVAVVKSNANDPLVKAAFKIRMKSDDIVQKRIDEHAKRRQFDRDAALSDLLSGMNYSAIGRKHGVSRQAVQVALLPLLKLRGIDRHPRHKPERRKSSEVCA